ncbi:MAG: hypothetical protein HY359_03960 [Candidatus Rokubacteria bacterium]|nr:hypothetical protein [Candidatus Rokubacteria bacterium]
MTLALVMGATAAVLRAVDTLPAYLGGAGRGVERFDSVEAVERRLRERLWLPSYFPDTLRWPPAGIRLHTGPPPSVVLTFGDRGGEPRLVVFQSLGGLGAPPPEPLPGGRVLQTVTVPLHDAPAALSRVLDRDGRVWHELGWSTGDRRVVLRSRGPVAELLRMGESVRGPR